MAKNANAAPVKDEQAFMQVLGSCNDACQSMDFSDDGWKPEDGNYSVIITDVQSGTKPDQKGNVNIWVKPVFQIITPPEHEGKTFNDFYYIQPGVKDINTAPSLKNLLRLATCLASREIRNAQEAFQIINAAKSEALDLEIYRTVGKKGKSAGKTFVNIRFLGKLATENVPS